MIVSDIYHDAKQVLARCSQEEIYARLTDAIETLANKGQWEPLLGYVDIAIGEDNLVSLPPDVEMPLRVNIDNTPSFVRDRLYEFSLNGPGSDSIQTDWQWEERGTSPVFRQINSPNAIQITSTDAADNGKKIKIWGVRGTYDEYTDYNSYLEVTLNSAAPQEFPASIPALNVWHRITRVVKDVTVGAVKIEGGVPYETLAVYAPYITEPQYRQIRLSKTGVTAKILFRRKTTKITSQDDFIPLHSKMAILMMLKANEAFRNGTIEQMALGQAYEKQALAFLKEEQDSRNTFAELASQDQQPLVGLNINNRDSLIAGDVYDDAVAIFGKEGKQKTLDRISDAVEALANKSIWDGLDGYIDITVDENTVTLPRYVETPIAINMGGMPTFMRNKWFEFHLNGPGSEYCGVPVGWVWDDRGDVVTLKDVDYEQQLVAIPDSAADNGKYIRIFGYDDEDKWIRSANPATGATEDGFWVEIDNGTVVPSDDAQKVLRITRILKDETAGFVRLDGFDIPRNTTTTIGYYYPDETEPNYRRIRLGCNCGWVRMRYRKRSLKVTSYTDPLHLKSKVAVTAMMMSLASLAKGDIQASEALEQKAIQFISEEEQSRNPAEVFSFQFDTGTSWADNMQGIR